MRSLIIKRIVLSVVLTAFMPQSVFAGGNFGQVSTGQNMSVTTRLGYATAAVAVPTAGASLAVLGSLGLLPTIKVAAIGGATALGLTTAGIGFGAAAGTAALLYAGHRLYKHFYGVKEVALPSVQNHQLYMAAQKIANFNQVDPRDAIHDLLIKMNNGKDSPELINLTLNLANAPQDANSLHKLLIKWALNGKYDRVCTNENGKGWVYDENRSRMTSRKTNLGGELSGRNELTVYNRITQSEERVGYIAGFPTLLMRDLYCRPELDQGSAVAAPLMRRVVRGSQSVDLVGPSVSSRSAAKYLNDEPSTPPPAYSRSVEAGSARVGTPLAIY